MLYQNGPRGALPHTYAPWTPPDRAGAGFVARWAMNVCPTEVGRAGKSGGDAFDDPCEPPHPGSDLILALSASSAPTNDPGETGGSDPTPCAEPLGLTRAADGAVWFTQRATNRIGRMTTDGTFTDDFSIPTMDSAPARISSKSNGTVWLLETDANKLVRVDPR